jgi:xanthine dehydrogenase YagR molybdenum-binding subunit
MMPTDPQNRVALENDGVRLDIVEKVTGRAKYTTDHYLPRMLHAAYIRSPFGRSKLVAEKLDAARAVKGVLEVEITKREGRYHGDRLGHVCAESPAALFEAMTALACEFEHDRPRTRLGVERTPRADLKPADNAAQADEALARSDAVVEVEYETQVQTHCCLEPHIVVVDFRGDSAIAYGSTQGTFSVRDDLARALQLPPDRVEFHCEYVGGGFGGKFGMGAEGELAARMSKKYARPCRVGCDRKEEQLDTGNRPGSLQYMKIGVARDGTIQGGHVATWGSVGPTGGGQASAGGGGGGGVRNPSRYKFGTIAKIHEDVSLNGGFPRAMRAPGHPQAMFAVELCMDALAAKVAMDPVEFRLHNEINELRKRMLREGAAMIGWSDRKPDGAWPGVIKRGYGVGVGDWGNGRGRATITVNLYRNGTVEVLSGAQDIGTGYRTLLADIVHTHLGIERERVVAKVGNSRYPVGPASGGSVTSRTVAPRAFNAAEMARQGLIKVVAKEWELPDASAVSFADGTFRAGDRSIDFARACRLMTEEMMTFTASEEGEFWKNPTGSEAVQFALVEVDTETGIIRVKKMIAIQEVGLPVNRNTVENQITGAVIQGLSFCLFEDRILNRQTGAMVNANMDQYKIAGPMDVPEIVPVIWRSREDAGVNSLGEPPIVPTAGAIGCAIANAIGAQVTSMPITPDKVLAAIAAKERAR